MAENLADEVHLLYEDSRVAVVEVEKRHERGTNVHRSFLSQQLSSMVSSSTLCDLSVADGHKRYRIHRVVLTAQSPKYAGVFLKIEGGVGAPTEVVLQAVSTPEVLPDVLEYMYTGEYPFSVATVDETMTAAGQLDLVALKERCVAYLSNYDLTNVLAFLGVAAKHRLERLQGALAAYAAKYAAHLDSAPDFAQVSVEVLCSVLDCQLNTMERDAGALSLVFKWLASDREQRKIHFPKLLEKVNLKQLTPEELSEHVKAHEELFDMDECLDALLSAFKHHALSRAGGETT